VHDDNGDYYHYRRSYRHNSDNDIPARVIQAISSSGSGEGQTNNNNQNRTPEGFLEHESSLRCLGLLSAGPAPLSSGGIGWSFSLIWKAKL